MKTLIAIPTCFKTDYSGGHRNNVYNGVVGRSDYVRQTWAPKATAAGFDVRFFYGSFTAPIYSNPDDIILPVPDNYAGLPIKVREMFGWAYYHDYDFVLKIDDDSILKVENFKSSGYENFDYVGHALQGFTANQEVPYASGAGYVLSRKAMAIVKDMIVEDWAEDKEVGRTLMGKFPLHNDERYWLCGCSFCLPKIPKDVVLIHTESRMREMYEEK